MIISNARRASDQVGSFVLQLNVVGYLHSGIAQGDLAWASVTIGKAAVIWLKYEPQRERLMTYVGCGNDIDS